MIIPIITLKLVSPNPAYERPWVSQGSIQNYLGKREFTREELSQQQLMPSNWCFSFSSDPDDFGKKCPTLHSFLLL